MPWWQEELRYLRGARMQKAGREKIFLEGANLFLWEVKV